MNNYTTPHLNVLGSVEALTRASATSNQADSIFLDGVLVGPGPGGSLDACVSEDPQNPGGTCDVDLP